MGGSLALQCNVRMQCFSTFSPWRPLFRISIFQWPQRIFFFNLIYLITFNQLIHDNMYSYYNVYLFYYLRFLIFFFSYPFKSYVSDPKQLVGAPIVFQNGANRWRVETKITKCTWAVLLTFLSDSLNPSALLAKSNGKREPVLRASFICLIYRFIYFLNRILMFFYFERSYQNHSSLTGSEYGMVRKSRDFKNFSFCNI